MVTMSRSVAVGVEAFRGQNVWLILCRAALQGVEWAAAAFGVKDAANRVERAELLVGYGVSPELPHDPQPASVDWAGLDEFERGRVAREMRHAARTRQTY
jgi:hypothetical protein